MRSKIREVDEMGMTDKQFDGFLRFLLKSLKEVKEKKENEEKEKKLDEIIDDIQRIIEE